MLPRLAQLSVLAVLAMSGVALAADQTPSTSPAPAATQADQTAQADPIVCRTLGPPTGSRLGSRKICMHQSEWVQQEQNTRDSINKVQKTGTLINPGGG